MALLHGRGRSLPSLLSINTAGHPLGTASVHDIWVHCTPLLISSGIQERSWSQVSAAPPPVPQLLAQR